MPVCERSERKQNDPQKQRSGSQLCLLCFCHKFLLCFVAVEDDEPLEESAEWRLKDLKNDERQGGKRQLFDLYATTFGRYF